MNPLALLRSMIMMVLFPLFTMIISSVALVESILINSRAIEDRIVIIWARVSLFLFGVKVVESGRENIPKDKGCLYLFNHTSFFDVFALQALDGGLRFGSKIELFSIPVFGYAMKKFGVLPIARKDRDKVIKVYEDARARAEAGERFALSPEGGRNFEEKLLPFKAGPFLFAIRSGIPLVPVIIKGANDIMSKKDLVPAKKKFFSTITVQYLPAVEVKSYTPDTYKNLQAKIYQQMDQYF